MEIEVSDQLLIHTLLGDVIIEVISINHVREGMLYFVQFIQHPHSEMIGATRNFCNLEVYNYTITKGYAGIEPSEIYQLNEDELNELVTIFKEYSGKSI